MKKAQRAEPALLHSPCLTHSTTYPGIPQEWLATAPCHSPSFLFCRASCITSCMELHAPPPIRRSS